MTGHYSDVWQAVAAAFPDRPALRNAHGEEWTYARFAAEAAAFAGWLQARGVRPGEPVALLLYNRAEFLVAFFACLATGITPVPLNYRLRASELAALLDDSGAEVLVFPSSLSEVARAAEAEAADDVILVHVADDDIPAAPGIAWTETIATPGTLPAHAPDSGELWIYTGGTTGRPKAVRWIASEMFDAQLHQAYALAGYPLPESMDDAIRIASEAADDLMVNLPLAPLMHGTALTTSLNTLLVGGTVLLTDSPRFDPEEAVLFALRERATRIIVAGDAIALPLVEALETLDQRLETVTSVMSSGMRFGEDARRRLHSRGTLTILDLLASSEGGAFAVTTTTGVDDLPGRPQLLPSAAVLDENLEEVDAVPGARGVLAQRGALPVGYHRDPAKTAETFPVIRGTRFVIPGDWVVVHEDRHIEFLGRGSGVINTGGEKVYPREVEEALLSHPGVTDATVIGLPDPRFGEVVSAVVERSDPGLTETELIAHVGSQLAGYKKPRHVRFADSLDRTPTGKIDVPRLRSRFFGLRRT